MRATPLLLGCLLGLGAIASATAAGTTADSSMGSSSYGSTGHTAEHSVAHDTSTVSGDALSISHGASSSTNSSSSNHAPSSSSATDDAPTHVGGDTTPSGSSHSAGLGWQSLLPGSIQ